MTTQLEHPRTSNTSVTGTPSADSGIQTSTKVLSSTKTKKKKTIKPKTDDKPETTKEEDAALCEQENLGQDAARTLLYHDNYPAIQALQQCLNLPKAGNPSMDLSGKLPYMNIEWQKIHPSSFFGNHIFKQREVTEHLECCIGDLAKYLSAKCKK